MRDARQERRKRATCVAGAGVMPAFPVPESRLRPVIAGGDACAPGSGVQVSACDCGRGCPRSRFWSPGFSLSHAGGTPPLHHSAFRIPHSAFRTSHSAFPRLFGLCIFLGAMLMAGFAGAQGNPCVLENPDFEEGHEAWAEDPADGVIEQDAANAYGGEWYGRFRGGPVEDLDETISQGFSVMGLDPIQRLRQQNVPVPGMGMEEIYLRQHVFLAVPGADEEWPQELRYNTGPMKLSPDAFMNFSERDLFRDPRLNTEPIEPGLNTEPLGPNLDFKLGIDPVVPPPAVPETLQVWALDEGGTTSLLETFSGLDATYFDLVNLQSVPTILLPIGTEQLQFRATATEGTRFIVADVESGGVNRLDDNHIIGWSGRTDLIIPYDPPYNRAIRFGLPREDEYDYAIRFNVKIETPVPNEFLTLQLSDAVTGEVLAEFRVPSIGVPVTTRPDLLPAALDPVTPGIYMEFNLTLPAAEFGGRSITLKYSYTPNPGETEHTKFYLDEVTIANAVVLNPGFEEGPVGWEHDNDAMLAHIIQEDPANALAGSSWVARFTAIPMQTELVFSLMIENPAGVPGDEFEAWIYGQPVFRVNPDGTWASLAPWVTPDMSAGTLYDSEFREVRLHLGTPPLGGRTTAVEFISRSAGGTVFYVDDVCYATRGNCPLLNNVQNGNFDGPDLSMWQSLPAGSLIIGPHGPGRVVSAPNSARFSGDSVQLTFQVKILRENAEDYLTANLAGDELIRIQGDGTIACHPDPRVTCSPISADLTECTQMTVIIPGVWAMGDKEIEFTAHTTRGPEGAIFLLDDVTLDTVSGAGVVEDFENGDFEDEPLGEGWNEFPADLPVRIIVDDPDEDACGTTRFARFGGKAQSYGGGDLSQAVDVRFPVGLSFYLKVTAAPLDSEDFAFYFNGVKQWSFSENATLDPDEAANEGMTLFVVGEYNRVDVPLVTTITEPSNVTVRFTAALASRFDGTEFHLDDVCLNDGGSGGYIAAITGVRVDPVIFRPPDGPYVGVGRTFNVEVDFAGAITGVPQLALRPQWLQNTTLFPDVFIATDTDLLPPRTLRAQFTTPGPFDPIGGLCLDGLASVHIILGDRRYGQWPSVDVFSSNAVRRAAQFVIDTVPPVLDVGLAGSLWTANSRAADYLFETVTPVTDVFGAPPDRGPYVPGWPGVGRWPSSAGALESAGVLRGPQVFFNTSINPNLPDPLQFTVAIPFVDPMPVGPDGMAYPVMRAGFWANTLAPVTAAGVWRYPDTADYYPAGSTNAALGQYAGLPYPPGTGSWVREPGGNAPDFGPIVGAVFPWYDGGIRAQAQWMLADVPWPGGRSWHLPTFFEMADLAGNVVRTRDFSFWWQYLPQAVFTSGPEGTLTADPVFSWTLDRAGAEVPLDAFPCEPIAQFRVWRAVNPQSPEGTSWEALTNWSPWTKSPTIDRSSPVYDRYNRQTTLDEVLRNQLRGGDLLMITIAGADEAGNVQPIAVAAGDTLPNRFWLDSDPYYRLDSRTWYVPDSLVRLDTSVQARFWYNRRPAPPLELLRIDPGERDFGASTRIPIVPAENCDERIEAEFTIAMEYAGDLDPRQLLAWWELYEDNRKVAEGLTWYREGSNVVKLRIPHDILMLGGQLYTARENEEGYLTGLREGGADFLNQSPARCGCVPDRLGDDGAVYGVDPSCPGDAPDQRFRRRDVHYLFNVRAAYYDRPDIFNPNVVPLYADQTPASVQFTVFVPGDLRDEQPIKVYTRE